MGAAVKGSASNATPEIAAVLRVLDSAWVHERVVAAHDQAREDYRLATITVVSAEEFRKEVTSFVQHDIKVTEGREPSEDAALDLALDILNESFPRGALADGYDAALAAARGLTHGGLPDVINALAHGCARRALRAHILRVFTDNVELLSGSSRLAFGTALKERYGRPFERFGGLVDDFLVAQDPLGALWRVRGELERLLARLEGL